MDCTKLILDYCEKHYNQPFKVEFDTINIIELYHKKKDSLIFGEIEVNLPTTQNDLICEIEIGGPGFSHFDIDDNETECTFDKKQIRKYFEDLLCDYLSRDYDANYYS